MKELSDMPLKDFVHEISTKSPTPGCGSVAALCGALGAALTAMVANITKEDKRYSLHGNALSEVLTEISQVQNELATSMQRDAESFSIVINAFSLPGYPEDARIRKKEAIQQALKSSTMIPFEIMTLCSKGLRIIQKTIGKTTPKTLAELGSAAILLNGAIKSVSLAVIVNLQSIEDQVFVQNYKSKSQEILAIGENLYREIHSHCIKEILSQNN